jgi:tRNA pseudouridine13 synthase
VTGGSTSNGRLGGRIRVLPEDFVVEEIPLSRPTGRGDHVLCHVEKRDCSTLEVLLWLSKAAKVSENVIGYAGLKDSRAVARQYMTVPRSDPARLERIERAKFRILSAERHSLPLKVGHLKGNRFTIRVRDADLSAVPAARERLERASREGLRNAYGEQRFGIRGEGPLLGRAIVDEDWAKFVALLLGAPSPAEGDDRVRAARAAYEAGDLDVAFERFPLRHRVEKKALAALRRTGRPRDAFEALGQRPRKIWVAAWQAWIFNLVLARREEAGTRDRLLAGDVAWLHESGACVPVRDEARERTRAEAIEASPTGPLVGYDLRWADGEPGRIEREVARAEGAEPEAFRPEHARARGGRRPFRVPVREASLEVEADGNVLLRFVLPPGSFATTLLAEVVGTASTEDPSVVRGGE